MMSIIIITFILYINIIILYNYNMSISCLKQDIFFIFEWQQNKKKIKKSYFFLMAWPYPPPPLNGTAIKKTTFCLRLP